jgi:FKBP-type peptidyl-prolyl cis-trans isomerase 2
MVLQKKDFIEIEFTGKTKEGEIFDSNIKEDLKKANLKVEPKPFIFCLGEDMFLKSIEDFLIGKEIKEYFLELSPEKAFGKRNSALVQVFPAKTFREHKLNPIPGTMFSFDGKLAKVISVSGGRVIVDFNNPLAGKEVNYKIKVMRKVEDINEKIKAFNEFLFRKDFDFEIKEQVLFLKVEKELIQFIELFKEKYKEVLGLDLEVKEAVKSISSKLGQNKEAVSNNKEQKQE